MAPRVGHEHYDAQNVGNIMTRPPRTLDVTASVMDTATLMRSRYRVAVALHGHAHHGRLEGLTRSGVPVYNVCIPVLERLSLGHPPYWMVELDPVGSPTAVGRRARAV